MNEYWVQQHIIINVHSIFERFKEYSYIYISYCQVLKLQHLKTSIECVRGQKCYKNDSTASTTDPETTLQNDASDVSDSESDFQFEKDDFNSSDSEFDVKEKKKFCKKRDRFVR